MTEPRRTWPDDLKACCAALYEDDLVHRLLGGVLHPGGEDLTRRLADLTGVGAGDRVLDVASGLGTTARLLAAERGTTVVGIDLSPGLVGRSEVASVDDGLGELVSFRLGDAERLPVDAASFDVVLCECALCTFPDQAAAVAGFRRALAPGGRVGIADVTLERDRLSSELDSVLGRVACIAGAQPAEGYERLLRDTGFVDVRVEPHPDAVLATVASVGRGLEAMRGLLRDVVDVDGALELVRIAEDAARSGTIGYAVITGRVGDDLATTSIRAESGGRAGGSA